MEIHDLYIQDTEWRGNRVITIVKESDPLLRRFGQSDLLKLGSGEELVIQRQRADEVWSVVAGRAAFSLTDLREDSSSFNAELALRLDGESPQTLLLPFGVACCIKADQAATLIRLTTHQDDDNPDDKTP